jgi:hypothetical protein
MPISSHHLPLRMRIANMTDVAAERENLPRER